MAQAGVNLVSFGMFSWANIEPRRGEYHFEWLDEVFDVLHDAGIAIDLATPTAAPPAWFLREFPEARVVDRTLTPLGPNSRGSACPASPVFREHALRITRALAERYGQHPALAMWHVHNEYGLPVSESFTPEAQQAFRDWTRVRYGSLDAVNTAWGMAFWGQTLGDWEDITGPVPSPSIVNPSLQLDWRRFNSDLLLSNYVAERDALREVTPHIPITTNFHSCPWVDQWRWAQEVDVVATDHYLRASDARGHVDLAQTADLTRSVAQGHPWMLMEHSTSGVNWQPRNIAKNAGEMARNSLSHLGRGADAIMFFQWRASVKGAEKFHSAMLPHGGTDTRIWREVCDLGEQLSRLDDLRGSRVQAQVAVLLDWNSQWAQDLEWRPSIDLTHGEQTARWYDRLWRDHITADFAHPEADLSSYRAVFAPASYLLTDVAAANLRNYVAGGGTLVVGPFSGVVDENDGVRAGGWNAALAEVLGVRVQEYCPLRGEDSARLQYRGGETLVADVWTEDLMVTDAEVLAHYVDGPRPGQPAITRHGFGAGSAWYVASDLSAEDLAPVFTDVYDTADVFSPELPDGVEVIVRAGDAGAFATVINHSDHGHQITVPGTDVLMQIAAGEALVQRL